MNDDDEVEDEAKSQVDEEMHDTLRPKEHVIAVFSSGLSLLKYQWEEMGGTIKKTTKGNKHNVEILVCSENALSGTQTPKSIADAKKNKIPIVRYFSGLCAGLKNLS